MVGLDLAINSLAVPGKLDRENHQFLMTSLSPPEMRAPGFISKTYTMTMSTFGDGLFGVFLSNRVAVGS